MMYDFSIDEFIRILSELTSEVKRGKSMNSMAVRQCVLYLVDFYGRPQFEEMIFAAREARALKQYERTRKP